MKQLTPQQIIDNVAELARKSLLTVQQMELKGYLTKKENDAAQRLTKVLDILTEPGIKSKSGTL